MATLKDNHREAIVRLYAEYNTNTTVIKVMEEEFGIKLSIPQVRYYNPDDSFSRGKLHDKWKNLHKRLREEYKSKLDAIPVSQMAYQLRRIQRRLDHIDSKTNSELEISEGGRARLEMELLQEAQKILGKFYDRKELAELESKQMREKSGVVAHFNQQINHYNITDK